MYSQGHDDLIDQIEDDYIQDTTAVSSSTAPPTSEERSVPIPLATNDSLSSETPDSSYDLEVHFIDVGQGDATLLISDN